MTGVRPPLPAAVSGVLDTLEAAGHEAALVGGCVRDLLRNVPPGDWDVATSAQPEEITGLFPGSELENRFGTVTVRRDGSSIQVTPHRTEASYTDRRRPDAVRFGGDLQTDLARRDFTVNAIAWRADGGMVDPFGGRGDLEAGVLRAVGDADARLGEDSLRLVRAVRFASLLGLRIEPVTWEALVRHTGEAAGLSGERVREELVKILGSRDAPPSRAFLLMEELGLLAVLLPELTALRGVPQDKALAGDALDHSLRTANALPPADPTLRLAGLLHDVGKATTLADGHFIGHERDGADVATSLMRRLRYSRADAQRVAHLVRHHMFAYSSQWTDAAVRRFVNRVGAGSIPDLLALRRADNAASGVAAEGELDELAGRIETALGGALETRQLAIDGNDLVAELGMAPGPEVGRLLARLLEAVIEEPTRNERETLLALARAQRAAG